MNIKDLKSKLTKKQYEAASTSSQNMLLLAGAGTGKTSTIIGRVIYLCEYLKVPASEILMLAFGKDAALEMQERLSQIESLQDIEVRTFHSLGLSIVSSVEGSMPKLTSLSEDKNLENFISNQVFCDKDRLIEYFKFYENDFSDYDFKNAKKIWRSLNDDFFDDPVRLIVANILYLRGIRYISNCLFEKDIYLNKKYNPYEIAFFLPDFNTYLGYQDSPQEKQLHIKYGTHYIDLDFCGNASSPYHFANEIKNLCKNKGWGEEEKFRINSIGRVKTLSKLLIDVFLFVKSNPNESFENWGAKKKFLGLWAKEIYKKYLYLIESSNEIDFDKMIVKSSEYVKSKKYVHSWKYILVDEFQDISKSRFNLLKGLIDQDKDISLFCVGDDWQTIYQFAGSELKYIRNLDQYLSNLNILALDRTFRFHTALANLSSKFVQQNPNQYKKNIESHKSFNGHCVTLLEYDIDLWILLNHINRNATSSKTCLILSRFNYQLPLPPKIEYLNNQFDKLIITTATIHKSKGREADYVILLNVESGEMGLPSEKESEIELYCSDEKYPHAQERRVFYVAITRAKEHVFIYYSNEKKSPFIEEILKEEQYVKLWNKTETSQNFIASVND